MAHGTPARRKSNPTNGSKPTTANGGSAGGGGGGGPTTKNPHCTAKQSVEVVSTLPVPPDGGWGWMVVFGSFMIHIVTDGMTYSFGLFYNEFLEYFQEGKGYTAWIVSILVGVTFASGPISSAFVNRYGCRPVTIAGAILAAVCMMISTFAQNVFTLIITIGLGTGLGFGLIYLPAIVSVTAWFEARRSLATGIAVCGSGFGTFVFAPLTEILISTYGWRGALLIISGIVLNCIIFGALFRPLVAPKVPSVNSKKATFIDDNTTKAELEPLKAGGGGDQFLQLPVRPDLAPSGNSLYRSNSVGHAYQINSHTPLLGHKVHSLESALEQEVISTNEAANCKAHKVVAVKTNSNEDVTRFSMSQPHLSQLTQTHRDKSASGTMYRPDILYQGSLMNIPEYSRSRTDLNGSGQLNRYGSLKHSTHISKSQEVEKCCGCITCSKETHDTISEMMNFSLLKDAVFIIFALSNFCTSIGFNMPYVYIVSQAETLNLDAKQSSYLIAIIGVANTVGRIILGYISDKTWVNRLLVYNACLTLCGIATVMCPLCTGFYSLSLYCAVFGFTIGAYVGLTSVILVDLLGLDKLTNAFGLLLLFQGVASFIGPPIGGSLYDVTQSYSPAFIMAGVMISISGLVMFAIPPLQRRNARRAEQLNLQEIELS